MKDEGGLQVVYSTTVTLLAVWVTQMFLLQVVDVEGKGQGVVSTRPFKHGELICEYSGELISYEEATQREADYAKDHSYGCYMHYFNYKAKKLW